MTWLIENWLAMLVIGLGIMSLIVAFVVYAVSWIAGRDDSLLALTGRRWRDEHLASSISNFQRGADSGDDRTAPRDR
jgi:hypothetical protein